MRDGSGSLTGSTAHAGQSWQDASQGSPVSRSVRDLHHTSKQEDEVGSPKLAFYGESERWPLSQDCLPFKMIRLSRLACGKLGGILRMARLTIDTEDLLP